MRTETETTTKRGSVFTIRRMLVGATAVAVCAAGVGIAGATRQEPAPTTPVAIAQGSAPTDGSPEAESLNEQLKHNAETGWSPVGADTPGGIGYVRTKVVHPTSPADKLARGEAAHVYDADQNVVGYWVNPLGFVNKAAIENGDFDWVAAMQSTPQGTQALSAMYPEGVPAEQSRIVFVRDE